MLRYQLNDKGVWEAIGRYDIGFYDRKDEGPPYIRADSSGGAAFGLGYTAGWEADPTAADAFLWMTGDALCWPKGPCLDPAAKTHTDQTEVHGVMGRDASAYQEVVPDAAFQPYPAPGPAYPAEGHDHSYLIDIDATEKAPAPNDATRIGDIAIYEAEAKKPDLKITKKALSDRCAAGSQCTFQLLIENISTVPIKALSPSAMWPTAAPSCSTKPPLIGPARRCSKGRSNAAMPRSALRRARTSRSL